MKKEVTETKVKGTEPVKPVEQTEAQTSPAVAEVLEGVSKLTYDERKEFNKKFSATFNQENDLRSGGNDFDAQNYLN